MRYAYFPGCKIAHHLPEYGVSTESVCDALGIALVKPEFGCCGWPVRDENLLASVYSAIRNLAITFREGGGALDIITPCKCCFGNLKYAMKMMREHPRLALRVNQLLAAENLPEASADLYGVEVKHLLTVLDEDIGAERLRELTVTPLTNRILACHYGCHALRPGDVTGFDDPLAPTVFERIVEALGARTVAWDLRLECCGHPLRGKDDIISEALMRKKLEDAASAGATGVVTACTYCQLQFDRERGKLPMGDQLHGAPEAVLISSLVAEALGITCR